MTPLEAQVREAIAIIEGGTDYERAHVVGILRNGLAASTPAAQGDALEALLYDALTAAFAHGREQGRADGFFNMACICNGTAGLVCDEPHRQAEVIRRALRSRPVTTLASEPRGIAFELTALSLVEGIGRDLRAISPPRPYEVARALAGVEVLRNLLDQPEPSERAPQGTEDGDDEDDGAGWRLAGHDEHATEPSHDGPTGQRRSGTERRRKNSDRSWERRNVMITRSKIDRRNPAAPETTQGEALDLGPIRERAHWYVRDGQEGDHFPLLEYDVPALIAEVERLRSSASDTTG